MDKEAMGDWAMALAPDVGAVEDGNGHGDVVRRASAAGGGGRLYAAFLRPASSFLRWKSRKALSVPQSQSQKMVNEP